jgi:hypothetical protein
MPASDAFDDFRDEIPIRLSDEDLAALIPDEDYEPLPEADDFWIDAEG